MARQTPHGDDSCPERSEPEPARYPRAGNLWPRHPQGRGNSCQETGRKHGFTIEFRQSNHEGQLVDWIQEAHTQKRSRDRHQIRPPIPIPRSRSWTPCCSARHRRSRSTSTYSRATDFRRHSYVSRQRRRDLRTWRARLWSGDRRHRRNDRHIEGLTRWLQTKTKRPGAQPYDEDMIRSLAKLLDETGLTEIEIERDG